MNSRWVLCALLVIMSIALMEAADFDFTITARFKNAVPSDPRYPYFDYCGFDCSKSDPKIRGVTSYCDTACRQFNNVWGPFCYTTGKCPNNFNSLFSSAIQLRWGAPAGESGMSGMGFTPVNNGRGAFNVQQEFKLGDLTHYNFPISANTVVPKFEFEFTISITRAGKTLLPEKALLFPMNCDETPNNLVPRPCPNPTCPYSSRLGCNNGVPGCPDQITFQSQLVNGLEFVLSDKSKYTLAITGFRLPGTTSTIPYFISDEKMHTTAEIFAVVTRACPDCSKAGTVPVFNQEKFTCECVCPTVPCPAGLVRQADCQCGCPQDVCGVGASAVLKDGKCTCNCTSGDADLCVFPKTVGACPNDNSKCCCICEPKKCPAPAKPSENTADCACIGCTPCTPKGKNWVPSTDNCTCICPTDFAKNCRADLEVFNPTTCDCDCKFPKCKDDFVSENCNCACSKSKLDAKCQALNRATLFVPFDPKNPNAGQCTCGPCVGNFKNNTATGLCECTLECDKTSFFTLDPVSCTCKCPPGGPTNCPKPQIPNPVTCKCDPCDVTKEQCECPPARKTKCDQLKRQYIFNSTFCGCTDCIGKFIDSDPTKESECTNCPLSEESCKNNDKNSLKAYNKTSCECYCPVDAKCPNPRDIYVAATCSCRPCLVGECVCGNGFVEAGELCDYGTNATECCKDCLLLDGVSCNNNKCGQCQRSGNESTCVDKSTDLCKSGECFNSTCATKDNIQICEVKFIDGACGDGDLCARRCLEGKCQDYDLSFASSRCATRPAECGACCTYGCNKATGNCTVSWDQLNKGCSDGLLCTINDTCVPNPGNQTVPLKCEGKLKCTEQNLGKTFGTPCTVWECSEGRFGACVEVPAGDSVSCPATGFCSLNGTCSVNGECVQPRRTCSSPDPCQVGRCREDLDKCEFVTDLANGLPCDDGDNCTSGDVCVEGSCKGNDACNKTDPGPTVPLVPLIVTAAVVAAAALVAGFFLYQAIQGANIMDPVSWGEVNGGQFDANPLYQEATKFGDNPLYQS